MTVFLNGETGGGLLGVARIHFDPATRNRTWLSRVRLSPGKYQSLHFPNREEATAWIKTRLVDQFGTVKFREIGSILKKGKK